MALFDDFSKKAARFTEKTIEKSSELADTAKTKMSIKSAEADLDDEYIKLGKLYYNLLIKDNIYDEDTGKIIQTINELKNKIAGLEASLEKEDN